jgi:hypothetical protein
MHLNRIYRARRPGRRAARQLQYQFRRQQRPMRPLQRPMRPLLLLLSIFLMNELTSASDKLGRKSTSNSLSSTSSISLLQSLSKSANYLRIALRS